MTGFAARRWLRPLGPLAVLAVSTVIPLPAQVTFLNDLFKNAHTLNLNWQLYQHTFEPSGVAPGRMQGFLFEIAFDVGRSGQRTQEDPAADSLTLAEIDSTVAVRLDTLRRSRTTRWMVPARPPSDTSRSQPLFEIALGYGRVTGLRSNDPAAYDLYGSVEEFPAVSVYRQYALGRPVRGWFYVGGRFGLASLSGVQAFVIDTDTSTNADVYCPSGPRSCSRAYAASGSTLLLGGIVGLQGHFLLDVFIEGAITYRRFDGIQWSTTATNVMPTGLPKEIRLTTWGFTIGLQLDLTH